MSFFRSGGRKPSSAIFVACLFTVMSHDAYGATLLPVGPISFDSNADYDRNFKEMNLVLGPPTFLPLNGILRNSSGSLSLSNRPSGFAVFDTSSAGGTGGLGGTSGANANNDLSEFIISFDVAFSVNGAIGCGVLFGLDDNENNGFAVGAHSQPGRFFVFDVNYDVDLSVQGGMNFPTYGLPLDHEVVPFGPTQLLSNTFYRLEIKVRSNRISVDFNHGLATAVFTTGLLIHPGQVGIILDTPFPGATAYLDNFAITPVPEASTYLLCSAGALSLISMAFIHRSRRP